MYSIITIWQGVMQFAPLKVIAAAMVITILINYKPEVKSYKNDIAHTQSIIIIIIK